MMQHDVFVSYSSKDKVIADALVSAMENNRIRCWYAPRDIKPGEDWGNAITSAIDQSKILLIIFSGNANRSQRVLDEINFAISQQKILFPFRVENLEPSGAMKLHLASRHWLDAYDPSWGSHIRRLIKEVSANLDISIDEQQIVVPAHLEKQAKQHPKNLIRVLAGVVLGGLLITSGWFGLSLINKQSALIPTPSSMVTTADANSLAPAGSDCANPDTFCVGLVLDTQGIEFGTNAILWEGIQRAQTELGFQADFLLSEDATQLEPNLAGFASQGYDLIIASSLELAGALAEVASQYPDVRFSIYQITYPNEYLVPRGMLGNAECIPNVMGQLYRVDQAAYLAGYLAAGMAVERDPADPKLGTFGGANMTGVTTFDVGFQQGMEAYNAAHGTNVSLLGWNNTTGEGSFTNNFWDLEEARQVAESMAQDGVDILNVVADPYVPAALAVARERGMLVIGADTDGYQRFDDSRSALLTSVRKRLDNVVYELIMRTWYMNFRGCTNYFGDIANGGVDLAPFHDLDTQVPPELKAEINALENKIKNGELTDTGCISFPDWCEKGLYPE
jgi:basic membrane protein A and related proteins